MTIAELEKETIDVIVAKLEAMMKEPLDKRDTNLCAQVGKLVDEKVKAAQEEWDRKRAQFNIPGVGKEETKKFSFHKIIRAKVTGNYSDCAYELEMIRAAEELREKREGFEFAKEKAMTAGTDSAGGFLVPSQVLENELIPLLRDELIAVALGARMWTGLVGSPQEITKVTAGSTGYWVGEAPAAGITQSQPALSMLKLTEHTCAASTVLSNRLIRSSSGAAEALVREDIVLTLKELVDTAFFVGTGLSNQPKGILETSGISTVTSFGSASAGTAYNKLLDMIFTLAQDKALRGKLGWAIHPGIVGAFNKMADATDQPKERRLFDAQPVSEKLLGYPYKMATYLPATDLIFANWDDAGIGMWGEMTMMVSNVTENMMKTLQTMVVASMSVDVGVRREKSFCHTTGLTLP